MEAERGVPVGVALLNVLHTGDGFEEEAFRINLHMGVMR